MLSTEPGVRGIDMASPHPGLRGRFPGAPASLAGIPVLLRTANLPVPSVSAPICQGGGWTLQGAGWLAICAAVTGSRLGAGWAEGTELWGPESSFCLGHNSCSEKALRDKGVFSLQGPPA